MKDGFIVAPVACLHREPDRLSEVVTQGRMGEAFRVLEESEGWLRVALCYDNYEGFLEKTAASAGEWPGSRGVRGVARVRSLFANVLAGPKLQTALVAVLPMGVKVPVHGEAIGDWIEVELPLAQRGYVHQGDLDLTGSEWTWHEAASLRQSLVATARRLIGLPYRWGGTSTFGIDCSGFVQFLYFLHGLYLPRDANQQAASEVIRRVDRDEIVPGDLIFFANLGHVGMAISHHEFIHATIDTTPCVQVSRVDDPKWVTKRDEIRRYILP